MKSYRKYPDGEIQILGWVTLEHRHLTKDNQFPGVYAIVIDIGASTYYEPYNIAIHNIYYK